MPRDVLLQLASSSAPITATSTGTPIVTEGGMRADVEVEIPALVTGSATPTDTITVQASIDGGTNWYEIGHFPAITAALVLADITTALKTSFRISRPVYVPRPTLGTAPAGGYAPQTYTRVRLSHVVSGTTPSFQINAFLEPVLANAVKALDEQSLSGLAKLV